MACDEVLIQQNVNLYALAVDGRRWDLFDQVFAEDVRADYGRGGYWSDRATLVADFARLHERYDHTQHLVTGHVVRVDGDRDRAVAFSRVSWRLATTTEGGYAGREGDAWYDDVLRRTGEGWRIADRRCRITWSRAIAPRGAGGPAAPRDAQLHAVEPRLWT
ncbi:nuclear transport factor 2 family protein [Mumia zhuanghuii]|uniref:Nuclear transport factor 2 family protein n=2 Tax=Mumia TaxID=1546255 RepID=A0ABW1QHB2_9ACTN|nr:MULTISPECIES: nuclear transport factor 2 family protein [Mumia]KAA1423034.1 nuclear transport factor 2 family protein [Mumia zhuanghuii]